MALLKLISFDVLSGAGGASCQMCTATHNDLKDRELVVDGFPINRTIFDAIQLFGELEDIHSFFALPSNERYNLTHFPLSTVNIIAASPLHSYTCIFRWFNLLIYHLHIGKLKWSPTSPLIKNSMKIIQKIVEDKTGLRIDGGTTLVVEQLRLEMLRESFSQAIPISLNAIPISLNASYIF